jgi:UDP-glucose 4-epimerase
MNINGLKAVVTGGAGFIGSHLVDALLEKENEVVVIDDFTSGKRENLAHHKDNANLKIIEGDIRNRDFIFETLKSADIVYHLAVRCLRLSLKDPVTNHDVNVGGTLNLLMASLENKIKRFVYVSSSEAYGTAAKAPMDEEHPLNPMTVYGATKAAGELYTLAYLRTYKMDTMVVRPFNTYGPRSHFEGAYGEVIPKFVIRVLNGLQPIIFGDGTQTRDFTYVTDTVKGMIVASECDKMIGECVNVARGVEVSISDIARIIINKLERNDLQPVYEIDRPGDVLRHFANVQKAKNLFGYVADIDIDAGIDKYIKWFTSQGYDYKTLINKDKVFNW